MAAAGLEHLTENDIDEILSRLPTKDAVRTSVLSRSWRHRWKSIPDLDLSFIPLAAAEKTLRLHSAPVRHLKFQIGNSVSVLAPSTLEPLFEAIARRSSTSLRSIDIYSRCAFPLSTVAHCFPRLTLIKLSACVIKRPHRTTIFPHLRTLDVADVIFDDDRVREVEGTGYLSVPIYFPACPKLEKLTLDGGRSVNSCDLDTIGRDFPRLGHLELSCCHLHIAPSALASLRVLHLYGLCVHAKLSVLFSSCPSLETLLLNNVDLVAEDHLHVSAPNLRLLELAKVTHDGGCSLRDFSITNSPVLETVFIDLFVQCGWFEEADERTKVLGGLTSVKKLTLRDGTIEFLRGGLVPEKLPTSFEHLTHLFMDVDLSHIRDTSVFCLLITSSPNLQEVQLKVTIVLDLFPELFLACDSFLVAVAVPWGGNASQIEGNFGKKDNIWMHLII